MTVLLLLQCGEPFKEEDMIVINGTKEEVEILKQQMLERREKAKSKVCLTSKLSVSDLFRADSKIEMFCFRNPRRAKQPKRRWLHLKQKVCV